MKYITFKQQFTFPEEAIIGFAKFMGWEEKKTREVMITVESDPEDETTSEPTVRYEQEEYDNEETYVAFVERKAVEHSQKFTVAWAETLKNQYIAEKIEALKAELEPQLHEQIIKPVEEALKSEIIIN